LGGKGDTSLKYEKGYKEYSKEGTFSSGARG